MLSEWLIHDLININILCFFNRIRNDYTAELDGLSKDRVSLRRRVLRYITSKRMALSLCLIADHIPLSAILLKVQLEAPDCGSFPVSVRTARMTLAAIGLLVDSIWRLVVCIGRLTLHCQTGHIGTSANFHWCFVVWSVILKTINMTGSSATATLASLCLVIQLMTSNIIVAPPNATLRTIGDRVRLENWIATSCAVGHMTTSNEQHFIPIGQVICIRELIGITEKLNHNGQEVLTKSISCPESPDWDKSNCTIDDVVSLMSQCLLTFRFRPTHALVVEYSYSYGARNNNSLLRGQCGLSFIETTQGFNIDVTIETRHSMTSLLNATVRSEEGLETYENISTTVGFNSSSKRRLHDQRHLDSTASQIECHLEFVNNKYL